MSRRIAFYAPMKPPDHPVPSGDRRMARALLRVLAGAGHEALPIAGFRSYDRTGDPARQARLEALGSRLAHRLLRRLVARPPGDRPEAWLSYHVYHKSPDHLGPALSRALDIPYLIVEASLAPKRAEGPWRTGYEASLRAIRAADVVLAMSAVDEAGLAPVVRPPAALRRLPPFTDPAPLAAAAAERPAHRDGLAAALGLDPDLPWLCTAAMMRADAKLESYRLLGRALALLREKRWQLLVAGDGPARPEVERALAEIEPGRVRFLGVLPPARLAAVTAASDLFVWPAVREAYGLAMLEAAGTGCPVVAGDEGGVAEVVVDGVTGLLTPPGDADAFAVAVRALLADPARRRRLGAAAASFVLHERSDAVAGRVLDTALADAAQIHEERRCACS